MSAVLLGAVTLAELVPTLAARNAALIAELSAQLAAAVALQASLNLQIADPAAMLSASASFVASGQAAASLSLVTPADLLASMQAGLSAQASVSVGLDAQLGAALAFGDLLGTGGIYLYALQGAAGTVGSDLQAVLSAGLPDGSGPSATAYGLALLTNQPPVLEALSRVLKTR